ncbi:MAG: quinoprotein dehydrogenase-associated SoxYZ-like carrier [Gammaproteobacteria bacterium]
MLVALLATCGTSVYAADPDPLNSPQWALMHEIMLGGAPYTFDARVVVLAPSSAEDAMNVPIGVRVDGLEIEELVVFADLNPIQKVLRFVPRHARPNLSFRIKIEQATPVRAAARTADGVWHVGGQWVDAAGGGCTAPSRSRATDDWVETLGQVRYHAWPAGNDAARLRLQIMHPMDTGLAPGIPAFYLDRLELKDTSGELYATLDLFEPISENPLFTFDLDEPEAHGKLVLSGRDINGNRVYQALD